MVVTRAEAGNAALCNGYQALTVDNTAGGVGFTIPSGSHYAIVRLHAAPIRWTVDDETTVSSTVGEPLNVGEGLVIVGAVDLQNFKAIRTGTVSGTLYCHFYR